MPTEPAADSLKRGDDLLAAWLEMGREVLERYYPATRFAVLVAEQEVGLPAVTLLVIPPFSSAPQEASDVLPLRLVRPVV